MEESSHMQQSIAEVKFFYSPYLINFQVTFRLQNSVLTDFNINISFGRNVTTKFPVTGGQQENKITMSNEETSSQMKL